LLFSCEKWRFNQFNHEKRMKMIMAMTQEPIDWRYLPYIRPIFQVYVREYPSKIWPKIWY